MIVIDVENDAKLLRELAERLLSKPLTQQQRHYYGTKLKEMMKDSFIHD